MCGLAPLDVRQTLGSWWFSVTDVEGLLRLMKRCSWWVSCSSLEVSLAWEEAGESWQASLDLGEVVEIPDGVGRGRGRAAAVTTCGQRVIDAVFLAGDLVVDDAGDVVEFFPFRPLRIGPLASPSAGQRTDRGDVSDVVWVTGGELVPALPLADQPGLEVPEPVAAAQAVHDQAVGAPHGVGVDRAPRGVQMNLEVDDIGPGDTAEPVLQPLDALPRTGRLPGGALQKEPEPIDVHARTVDSGRTGIHSSVTHQVKPLCRTSSGAGHRRPGVPAVPCA